MDKSLSKYKLRWKIDNKYGSIAGLAKAININRSVLSRKLNGKTIMSRKDIAVICKALDIDNDEIGEYFFD